MILVAWIDISPVIEEGKEGDVNHIHDINYIGV